MNTNETELLTLRSEIEKKALGPEDTFDFSCDRCGRCCREREDILRGSLACRRVRSPSGTARDISGLIPASRSSGSNPSRTARPAPSLARRAVPSTPPSQRFARCFRWGGRTFTPRTNSSISARTFPAEPKQKRIPCGNGWQSLAENTRTATPSPG